MQRTMQSRARSAPCCRTMTPLGGVAVFVAFLHKLGFVEKLRQHMPIQLKSPNHIDPTATFTAFLIAVLAGARRFAHTNWLRNDRALHALLGLSRFPIDDTIRNLFRRFGMGDVHRLFDPLAEWQMGRRLRTLWPIGSPSSSFSLSVCLTIKNHYAQKLLLNRELSCLKSGDYLTRVSPA